jgi:hypothetical protein
MAMAAMNTVSGVSFHLRCPQVVASVLCKKTPIFGSQVSKLDHLTVCMYQLPLFYNTPITDPQTRRVKILILMIS